jgi:GMP synthase-like glutamine amidotransferase
LLVQHRDHAPGDVLLGVLLDRRFEPVVVEVDRGEPLPDPTSLALAVVLGGDQLRLPGSGTWAGAELDWLRHTIAARVPVLALGTGAQLLATALGGNVERLAQPRRGWVAVNTADPQLIPPGPWLAWDEGAIELPPRAELLAHDRVGPQAFRLDAHLGVQFHPEITQATVCEWVRRSDRVLDVQGVMEATSRDITSASEAARRLFAGFADSVA